MRRLYILMTTLFLTAPQVHAKTLIRIKAIGSSPRGQFVAFEEYGYKHGRKLPFSKIRVMNVWKNTYVDTPVQVIGADEQDRLNHVRKKAKDLANKKLKKFNIST